MNERICVTGYHCVIVSEFKTFFAALAWEVHGVDNDKRAELFAP